MGFHVEDVNLTPAERMLGIGIVQEPHPVLREECTSFRFSSESRTADGFARMLVDSLELAKSKYDFSKSIGLSLPQLGHSRSGAVVQIGDTQPLVLFNPEILEQSDETEESFEGCLSLFNYRGMVARPLEITVAYADLIEGSHPTLHFNGLEARMWAHEIDHLNGILYTDRMANGEELKICDSYKLYARNRLMRLEGSQ